jgi:hypothetical protein
MAISDFQVGGGQLALPYGKHVAAGILAGHDDSNPTAVKIKVLLCMGEIAGIDEISFEGTIIDPANYTFHPGTLSNGEADVLQGLDSRFPAGIFHSRVAYYTATLPDGLGADERPDKMRTILRGLKVNVYDDAGMQTDFIYSVNPANVFVDLVRRNCERLGLPLIDHVDWPAYDAARKFYDITVPVDDGERTPENVTAVSSGSGSLAAGTWWMRVSAIADGGFTESAASKPVYVTVAASGAINLTWDSVPDAEGYRLYVGQDTTDTDNWKDIGLVTGYSFTAFTGFSTGKIKEKPIGDWQHLEAQLQCHRAFTQADILTGDALSAVMFDAASDWVRDGKKHRIILPNPTTVSHRIGVDNSTDGQYQHYRVPVRDRANRVSGTFRNLFNQMKPEEAIAGNDLTLQSRIGVVEEKISLGSMNDDQMRRIGRWRFHDQHEKPRRMKITAQGDASHLLVNDLVDIADRQGDKRNSHGDLAESAGVIWTSLFPISAAGGTASFGGATPRGRTRSVDLPVYAAGGAGTPSWTSNITPFTVGPGGSILTYIKVGHSDQISEVIVTLGNTSTGARRIATLRRPQTASSITPDGNDVATRNNLPPFGSWVPINVDLSDFEGLTFDQVGGAAAGTLGTVRFAEFVYFEDSAVTYRIEEIEDSDSDSADERILNISEHNPEAYDPRNGASISRHYHNWALDPDNVVTASSTNATGNYPLLAAVNGVRHTNIQWVIAGTAETGNGWENGSGTPPAWIQIDFPTARTIDEMEVFTIADAVDYDTEPTLDDTFTLYGIVDFKMQYWNGAAWVDAATFVGNNKVWTRGYFPAVATDKVRLYITNFAGGAARVVEFQVWGYEDE